MELQIALMACITIPVLLYGAGHLIQTLLLRRSEPALCVPLTAMLLGLLSFLNFITRINPLYTYGVVLLALLVLWLRGLKRKTLHLDWKEMFIYLVFSWLSMIFLLTTEFVGFGLDWVVHGVQMPAYLLHHKGVTSIRSCIMSLFYADLYAMCSPDMKRLYLVQIMSACLNASIVLVFLRYCKKASVKYVAAIGFFCCPFVLYECAFTWPKMLATGIAALALLELYSEERDKCRIGLGLLLAAFSTLVHPMSAFILLTVPIFFWRDARRSRAFVTRYLLCLGLVLILPKLVMGAIGVKLSSATLYYPFFDDWRGAVAAHDSGMSLWTCAASCFNEAGMMGMLKKRVLSLLNMGFPLGGVSRYAFWENLVFAMGPVSFVLAAAYVTSLMTRISWNGRVRLAGWLLAPVLTGVVFTTGYMLLQVSGGQWLVLVLSVCSCRSLSLVSKSMTRSLIVMSVFWNALFMIRTVTSIRLKAPDWAPGIIPSLDAVGSVHPGYSSQTPVYLASLLNYRWAIVAYMLWAFVFAFYVATAWSRGRSRIVQVAE
jgi:hypothetical protein